MMWQNSIESHYNDVWQVDGEVCEFAAGPIDQLPYEFAVLKFPPHGGRKMWTYSTRCMSLPQDLKAIEIHMFSAFQTSDVIELLVAIAHFHRTSTKLDIGHTVNFGRPWIHGSDCKYGLVSLPYLDGPKLEIFPLGGRSINFYWLVPITKAEMDFKKKHGTNALEMKFDTSGFDFIDPQRKSVV